MRLSEDKKRYLTRLISDVRPEAEIYLFGSRVNDNLRGGDIDILILGDRGLSLTEKLDIKRRFFNQFGEQKLDIVAFTKDETSSFKEVALESAIRL